jgi:hypothetical protein
VVAVPVGPPAIGQEAREIGAAHGALLDAGFHAGTSWRELEVAFVAGLSGAGTVGEEFGEQGAAFETMFFWK